MQEENPTHQNKIINNLNTNEAPQKPTSFKGIWGAENSFISICYHGISDNPNFKTSITPQSFEEQIKIFKKNNFKSISFDDVTGFLDGNISLPEKSLLITFDDGEESIYETAMPILMKYGYIGNLFLVLDKIDNEGFLSQKQIKELIARGFGIGSHSATHAAITDLNDKMLRYEIEGSKNELEALFGVNVDYFAYPYGLEHDTKKVKDIIFNSGYRGAFTVYLGVNDKTTNTLFLLRHMVNYDDKSGEQNIYIKAIASNNKDMIIFLHSRNISMYLKHKRLLGAEIEAQNLLKIDSNNSYAQSKLRLLDSLRTEK